MSNASAMADLISEISDDKAKNQSGPPSLKIKDGASARIRVLPGTFGKKGHKWFVEITEHWLDTPDGKARPFLCVKHQYGEECQACVAWDESNKMVDALESDLESCTDKGEAEKLNHKIARYKTLKKKFAFRKAYLMNVVNRADQTPTVLVYTAPKTVWESFCNEWLSAAKEEDLDVLDPRDGFDFTVSRTTENKMTKYSVTTAKKASPVAEDAADLKAILSKRYNLEDQDTFLAKPKISKMEDAIAHIGKLAASVRHRPANSDDDYDLPEGKSKPANREGAKRRTIEEEDDTPPSRSSRSRVVEEEDEPPARTKSRVVDEEDDTPPSRSSRTQSEKRRVVEEDDEPPARTKSRVEDDESPTDRARSLKNRFADLDGDD